MRGPRKQHVDGQLAGLSERDEGNFVPDELYLTVNNIPHVKSRYCSRVAKHRVELTTRCEAPSSCHIDTSYQVLNFLIMKMINYWIYW